MRSVLAYTAARLLLFAVTFGVLYLLGARGLLAAALAVLVSGLVSFVLLSRQRDAMSGGIADRINRVRGLGSRLEAGAAKEDDAQQAAAGPDQRSDRAETAGESAEDPTPTESEDNRTTAEPQGGDGAQPARQTAEEPRSSQEDDAAAADSQPSGAHQEAR